LRFLITTSRLIASQDIALRWVEEEVVKERQGSADRRTVGSEGWQRPWLSTKCGSRRVGRSGFSRNWC